MIYGFVLRVNIRLSMWMKYGDLLRAWEKIWTNYRALEQGIELMVRKYGQSADLRKNFSYHFLGLAERCLMDGI